MNANLIILIIVTIIGSGIAYYLYKKNPNQFVTNNEYVTPDLKQIQLILFYVTWCPHSQAALKKWNDIQTSIANEHPNCVIDFSAIDCDKNSEMANTFNIKEYPTIILVKGVTRYEYDANLSEDTLNLFINTVMK